MHLPHECKIVRVSGSVAAGVTAVTPASGVDTAGFNGVLFIALMGAVTAGATTSLKAQESSVVDGTGDAFEDIHGSGQTIADDGDNKMYYVDVLNPRERFVRPYVSRADQNSVVEGIIAILYGAKDKPVTQDATLAAGKAVAFASHD